MLRTYACPVLACVLALSACDGDGTDTGPANPPPPTPPPEFTFADEVKVVSSISEIPQGIVDAQKAMSAFMSAAAVVVSDHSVQELMQVNGVTNPTFRSHPECWLRPLYPMFSFTIDYGGCYPFSMAGGAFISNSSAGPLLFEWQDYVTKDRQVGGVLALDPRDAFPQDLFWLAYTTDGTLPGPDNNVPVGVRVGTSSYGISYDGGAAISFLEQRFSMWGVATVTSVTDTVEVIHGGTDPIEVAGDDPPGATVVQSSLNYLECRCPTSGLTSYSFPLHFSEVTIDIDDLEGESADEIDDPELVFEVDYDVDGQAQLTGLGCGAYDVVFEAEAALVPITRDVLVARISTLCDTGVIDDAQRCVAMLKAADELGDFSARLSKNQISLSAAEAIDTEFDGEFCGLY